MDPAVSRRKFDAEIRSLETEAAGFVAARGWRNVVACYPILKVVLCHPTSGREIEFRFSCDDWDELPPSLSLHHPVDGRPLTWPEWPKGGWSVLDRHPSTGKPFLCLPGIREYHTHPSHLSESWEGFRLRGTYQLRGIVDRVQQRFEDTNG